MNDKEYEDALAGMTDEEREEYLKKKELMDTAANHLQGAVMCLPDIVPGFMSGMNVMGIVPPPGMPSAPSDMSLNSTSRSEWIDDDHWKCTCGSINESKFCPECGYPAPPPVWLCPDCGARNQGKFCTDCGAKRP